MKIGIANKLTTANTTLTGSITAEPGKDEENILDDDTLYIWEMEEGAGTLTIELDSAVDMDLIGVYNLNIETSIQIDAYSTYPGTIAATKTMLTAALDGIDFKSTFLELSETTSIDAIKLTFVGATATFKTHCGYIWAGEVLDVGDLEQVKPSDISADNVTITRANQPDIKEVYVNQAYDVTTKKTTDYFTLRGNVRTLLANGGYAGKRPFLFNNGPFSGYEETILGIFDAAKFSPDLIYMNSEWDSQITLGIREVF